MKKNWITTIPLLVALALVLTACGTSQATTTESSTTETTSSSNVQTTTQTSEASDDHVVEIKDAELEKIIRDQIDKPEGDILVSDMEMIYFININFQETPVRQIDGLEYAVNLDSFGYRYGELQSLDPLANLPQLGYLNCSYSTVEEQPVDFMTPMLDRISFIECNLSDFSFLENLTTMADVTFMHCNISSIEFLKNSPGLVDLNLVVNSISDLSPLQGMTALVYLTVHGNEITDLTPLAGCTSLESLNISYNHVTNLKPIMDIENLKELTAYEELDQKIIDRNQIQTLIDSGVKVDYHQ